MKEVSFAFLKVCARITITFNLTVQYAFRFVNEYLFDVHNS